MLVLNADKFPDNSKFSKLADHLALKCPLTRVKVSNTILQPIFSRKCMAFSLNGYLNKNTSNDVFHFLCKYNAAQISACEAFSGATFLLLLCKNQFNRLDRRFFRHRRKALFDFLIKICKPTIFTCLRSKLTSETFQKVGSLNGKVAQSQFKTPSLLFPLETPVSLQKNKKMSHSIFYYKYMYVYKFYALIFKNDSRNG